MNELWDSSAEALVSMVCSFAATKLRSSSSGVCSVASAGFNVQGLMYTHRRRAFSSGDKLTLGTLA